MKCKILNEVTMFCRDKCSSSDCCPENECVLYRIERTVMKMDEDAVKKALDYCDMLIDQYDSNRDITDIDICTLKEILIGRE